MKTSDAQNIEVEDIRMSDSPDFCDAYISYAEYEDGTPFTTEELDELNGNQEFVYQAVLDNLY